jgi:4-amino-4-deoxy-L-arabinose transferase-like glycosyltransferase
VISRSSQGLNILAAASVFAIAALHVATAALPDVYDELPGQYAGTAREMVESGNWPIPALNGIPRLQKPPLVYWITALSLRLFGFTEFGARLPTALALVGLVLITRALGARLYGPLRGTIAAAILGTSFGMATLGKLIMPEPFLALGIAFALYAAVRAADDTPRRRWWGLGAWIAAAGATFSKGLHGLLLPVVIVSLLATRSPKCRRPLAALANPLGLALFLALILPWPLYIESQFPGYLYDNFFNEQLGHVFDRHFPRDSEPTPLGLLWAQHLVWWFPWVLFAGAAALNRLDGWAHPLAALPAVWLLVTAVAASLTGQRQDYHTMSAWPAFALLLSRAWSAPAWRRGRRGATPALALPLAALLALGIVGLVVMVTGLSGGVETSASFGERNSVLGAVEGISGREWRRLRWLLLPAAGGLMLGAGGALALLRHPRTREWTWAPIAVGTVGPLLAAMVGLQLFAPLFGLKAIAARLEREASRDALIIYDGPSHPASSLRFYSDLPVRWLERSETEFAVRSRGIGRDRFLTESEAVARWRTGEPVWLVTEESRLDLWRARLGGDLTPIVARSGTRVLVRLRAEAR